MHVQYPVSRRSVEFHILNNKAIVSQNVVMLKCARGSIINQDRPEINNSDWLLGGGVSSVKGVCL